MAFGDLDASTTNEAIEKLATRLTDTGLVFEGTTDNEHETTVVFTDPTADRTITFPNASGTVIVNASAVVVAPITTTTATTGSLPTADGTVTISDATTPTVGELLEYCVELETKLEAILTKLTALGITAAS